MAAAQCHHGRAPRAPLAIGETPPH